MIGSLAAIAGIEIRDTARRSLRVGGLVLVSLTFAVGASAYGLGALNGVLAERYGAMNANLMVGGGLLTLSLVFALVAWLVQRQPRSRETRTALAMAAAPLALSIGRKLAPTLLKATPLILIAGILAGRALAARDE